MFINIKKILNRYLKLIGVKGYIYILLWILLYVLSKILIVLIPNYLFNMFVLNIPIVKVFLLITVMVLATILASILYNKNSSNFMSYRLQEISILNKFILNMPIPTIESDKGQKAIKKAERAVTSGNDTGLEVFFSGIIYFIGALFSVFAFIILTAKLPLWLTGVIFITPLVKIPLERIRLKKEELDINNMSEVWDNDWRIKDSCFKEEFGKEARMYNMIPFLQDKLYHNVKQNKAYNARTKHRENKINFCYFIIMIIRNIIILYAFLNSDKLLIDTNNFVLYLSIILNLSSLINECYENFSTAKINNIYVNDYFNLLESDYNFTNNYNQSMPQAPYEITFNNVCFSYSDDNKEILKDINFTIRANEKLAIVGRNGSGKSTLVKLVCGLYTPTKGEITINGVNIKNIKNRNLWSQLSVVFQKPLVFAASIAENISCCSKENIDYKKLEESIYKSNMYELVNKLENNCEIELTHYLDDNGITLSGGEIQRLMLARALYKESQILILDEPTAALDSIAESELYEKYNEYCKCKSSIFVSHRLNSTRFCDSILVLDHGNIAQYGTHESLMNEDGLYRVMYLEQAKNYNDDSNNEYEEEK